jgi:hypothetical protein
MTIACRLFAILLLCGIAACRSMAVSPAEFEKSSRDYNRMIRWQEFAVANATYVERDIRRAFEVKVAAAGGVTLVDYRILNITCDPEKGEAQTTVEFDYYRLPSTRVKTVKDVQKWVYHEEEGESGWRLTSLFPDFP